MLNEVLGRKKYAYIIRPVPTLSDQPGLVHIQVYAYTNIQLKFNKLPFRYFQNGVVIYLDGVADINCNAS